MFVLCVVLEITTLYRLNSSASVSTLYSMRVVYRSPSACFSTSFSTTPLSIPFSTAFRS